MYQSHHGDEEEDVDEHRGGIFGNEVEGNYSDAHIENDMHPRMTVHRAEGKSSPPYLIIAVVLLVCKVMCAIQRCKRAREAEVMMPQ